VCAAASPIGAPARASETQATADGTPPPSTISTTIAASVASMTAAISRFIGRAAVVTRA